MSVEILRIRFPPLFHEHEDTYVTVKVELT